VQPVDVLGRVDGREDGVLVQAGGLLDDEAGAARVGVELVDDRSGPRPGWPAGRSRRMLRDPDLGAVLVLGPDIPVAAGVVADEDRAEAGRDAPLGQRGHALLAARP
jgi:hypothetical protein